MNARKGSVLVYAVLVIAVLLASALAFSSLLNSSVKQTRFVGDATEAYYAAESGAERALWSVRKNDELIPPGDCGLGYLKCAVSIDDQNVKRIQMKLAKDQTFQFDLFNPDNPGAGANVESLRISWGSLAAFPEISSVEWTPGAQLNWNEYPAAAVNKRIIGVTGFDNYFSASKNYRVRVKALRSDMNNLDLQLFSSDNGGGSSVNFPNFLLVNSTGESSGATQTVTVKFNRYPPLSGMFDYVLFSEAKLKK